MPSNRFNKISFGFGHAHEVKCELIQQHVNSLIPSSTLTLNPVVMEQETIGNDFKIVIKPPNATKAFLVLTIIDESKMCFIVVGSRILLVSLVVNDKSLFTTGCVFTGFLTLLRLQAAVFYITDVAVYKGTYLSGMPLVLRRLFAIVFNSVMVRSRDKDALTIIMQNTSEIGELSTLYSNKVSLLLYPTHESFEDQIINQSFFYL